MLCSMAAFLKRRMENAMHYNYLSDQNAAQYISYLKKAIAEEPNMMWIEQVDEAAIHKRVGDPFYQNTKSILAFDGESVVGRIEYHFYGCLQDGYRMAYVDWVYVLPQYRHQGIAQQLFKEFEKDCKVNQINQYYLIRASIPGADMFYHSFENAELDDEPVLRKTIIE